VSSAVQTETTTQVRAQTAFAVLVTISFCHFLNDMVQSLIQALYPMLKATFALNFGQVGLITLTYQMTASLLQPFVGFYTDRRPQPYSLAVGSGLTLLGLLALSAAGSFVTLLMAASLVGMGSAVFHPESSRVARMASGGQHGLAQSLFQVGGNFGSSVGPLLAAFIVLRHGQKSIAWFSLTALLAMIVLTRVGAWSKANRLRSGKSRVAQGEHHTGISTKRIVIAITVLVALMFSKFFYLASLSSYYTFYLISRFHLSVQNAQIHLFIFLGAVAAGTIIGGPVGDRIGRKLVIWASILGVLPFSLVLPYANLFWTGILTVVIGLILASAFSSIVVYAQELIPGKIGMVSGIFFGFAFGIGGVGAALLGQLADHTSINYVYHVCSFLPAIGILTAFLPNIEPARRRLNTAPA
jgi:FSR family fosmidomycin resistance protein-like MFS transporter